MGESPNKTFGPSFKFQSNLIFKKSSLKKLFPFLRHLLICVIFQDHLKLIVKHYLSFCDLTNKIQVTVIIFPKFSKIHLKMVGSYHGSILKIDIN